MYEWAKELNCAITVCNSEGIILFMNEKARDTFVKYGELIGKNLFDCHNSRSIEKMKNILANGGSNSYTIYKNGIKKMIYQTVWKQDSIVKGLIEISMEISEEMPHYIRE